MASPQHSSGYILSCTLLVFLSIWLLFWIPSSSGYGEVVVMTNETIPYLHNRPSWHERTLFSKCNLENYHDFLFYFKFGRENMTPIIYYYFCRSSFDPEVMKRNLF